MKTLTSSIPSHDFAPTQDEINTVTELMKTPGLGKNAIDDDTISKFVRSSNVLSFSWQGRLDKETVKLADSSSESDDTDDEDLVAARLENVKIAEEYKKTMTPTKGQG